jgi:hypothetical protein
MGAWSKSFLELLLAGIVDLDAFRIRHHLHHGGIDIGERH